MWVFVMEVNWHISAAVEQDEPERDFVKAA